MKAEFVLQVLKSLYTTALRDILLQVVVSTETEWDDHLIVVCDALFDYRPSRIVMGGGHAG